MFSYADKHFDQNIEVNPVVASKRGLCTQNRKTFYLKDISLVQLRHIKACFCSLICIKSRNNHNIAEIYRKAFKIGHPIELDDLSSFSV